VAFAAGANAQVPWDNPSGSAGFFDWANGQNQTGLFGSPIIVGGDTFVFFPNAFEASATDGATTMTSDTFEVDLIASKGFRFTGIRIQELGTFAVSDGGSSDATGMVQIEDLASERFVESALVTDPVLPATSGAGEWTGIAEVGLTGVVPFTLIHVSYSNDLLAISTPGGTSFIGLDVVGAPVAVTIVPAPAGLALLLGLGAPGLIRRRR